jgi:predicted CopG family antitoxin
MPDTEKQPSRRVGIVIPEVVYEEGKEAAKRERRSFSNYIVSLIDKATKQEGKELEESGDSDTETKAA